MKDNIFSVIVTAILCAALVAVFAIIADREKHRMDKGDLRPTMERIGAPRPNL